jgi:hypothetical protein
VKLALNWKETTNPASLSLSFRKDITQGNWNLTAIYFFENVLAKPE